MLKNFIPPIYKSILEFRNDEFGVIEWEIHGNFRFE
jgi:hypothetical protein